MSKLKTSLAEREQRVSEQHQRADQLMAQLDGANQQLKQLDDTRQRLESERHELERDLVATQTKAKQAEAALEEQVQSLNVYKSMIADRDFKIESLENDLLVANGSRQPAEAPADPVPASGSAA
jgi:DNA repair exonuclease SbcCD ATPase subunit